MKQMTARLPPWLRSTAALLGAVVALASPLLVMGYIANNVTSRADSLQGAPLAVEPAKPAEARLGCWQLESTAPGAVSALWLDQCPDATNPTLSAGEYPLPTAPVYLSAWAHGTPKMQWAQQAVELREELSGMEDTQAGLLYLPATADGRGYFVAAWSQVTAEGEERTGIKVGYYGAPPTSVDTSAGRVFMSPPPPLREVLDDLTDAGEDDGDQAQGKEATQGQ